MTVAVGVMIAATVIEPGCLLHHSWSRPDTAGSVFRTVVRIDSKIVCGLPLTGAVDASSDTDLSQPSQSTSPYTSHWRYSTAALGWYQSFLALSRLPTASNQAVSNRKAGSSDWPTLAPNSSIG